LGYVKEVQIKVSILVPVLHNIYTSELEGLKFLRKRLRESQFIKATTSQLYCLFYYGAPVWLGNHTPKEIVKKTHQLTLQPVENS